MAGQHSLMKIVDLGQKRTEIGGGDGGITTNVSVLMASISAETQNKTLFSVPLNDRMKLLLIEVYFF